MVVSVSDGHHSKSCASSSCCSPSRLWRTIHTLVSTGNRHDLAKLLQDPNRTSHILRVLLTARMSNDASQYPASHKHRVIQLPLSLRTEAHRKFGRSVVDLNAVQIALFYDREDMAMKILGFLRQHSTPAELQLFLNHVWGQRNTTLHLACFLGMSQLVKLLLELGANPNDRNGHQLTADECGTHQACLALLKDHAKGVADRPPLASSRPSTPPPPSPSCRVTCTKPHPLPDKVPRLPSHASTQGSRIPLAKQAQGTAMVRTSSISSASSISSLEASDTDDLAMTWSPIPSPPLTPATIPVRCHNEDDLDRHKLGLPEPKSPSRQVCFEPTAILVDACTRGDFGEFEKVVCSLQDSSPPRKPPDIPDVSQLRFGAQNRSLLHLALMHGHPHFVRYLVDTIGVNTGETDADGWTALHYAAALGRWDCLQYLASLKGVDLFAQTDDGWAITDCPETEMDRQHCRFLLQRAVALSTALVR